MLADVSIRIRDLARSDERARLWKAVEDCGHLKIAKGNCNSQVKAFPTANRFAQMPLGNSQNCCLFRPHSVIRHAAVSGLHGDEATSALQLLHSL